MMSPLTIAAIKASLEDTSRPTVLLVSHSVEDLADAIRAIKSATGVRDAYALASHLPDVLIIPEVAAAGQFLAIGDPEMAAMLRAFKRGREEAEAAAKL